MGQKQNKEWYDAYYTRMNVEIFNEGMHLKRAEALAEIIAKHKPKFIIEVAAGGSILAQLVMRQLPDSAYYWSDFSDAAIDSALKHLAAPRSHAFHLDADWLFPLLNWKYFDAFVCVSMEHLEHDREILAALSPGTRVFLSIPDIDAEDHIRVLDSDEKIVDRYWPIISIREITPLKCGSVTFRLVVGERL